MSPHPQGGTPAGDAMLAIRRLARASDRDIQELLTLYALESLLARIAVSPACGDWVLKGGVLLAAFSLRRPTRDIDLQATGFANDTAEVADRLSEIVSIELDDGVVFDPNGIKASVMRDEQEYSGVRVRLTANLGSARLRLGVDVNFGDPIWPSAQPIELPRLLGDDLEPIHLLGYPLAMVLAEKTVTAIDRGTANTRWRDYADILTITAHHQIDADELHGALIAVSQHRRVQLAPLQPTLDGMSEIAQARWSTWRARMNRDDDLPVEFAEILNRVAAFADPVIADNAKGQTWDPQRAVWDMSHAVGRRSPTALRELSMRTSLAASAEDETLNS